MLAGRIIKETSDVSRFTIDLTLASSLSASFQPVETGVAPWLGTETAISFLTPTVALGQGTWATVPPPSIPPADPSPITVQSAALVSGGLALQLYVTSGTPGNTYTISVILLDSAGRRLTVEVGVTLAGQAPAVAAPVPFVSGALSILGGTMLGPLFLFRDPLSGTEAATKHYVDTLLASSISFSAGITVTAGGAQITGNSKITGTFEVTGATTLDSTLAVTGALSAGATTVTTLHATGAATLDSSLAVTGTFSSAGATVSTLHATGAATLDSTLSAGATTVTTLHATGATTLDSTLSAGATTVTTLHATGAATLDSTLSAGATTVTTLHATGAATLDSTLSAGATTVTTLHATGAATLDSTLSAQATTVTTLHATGLATLSAGILGTISGADQTAGNVGEFKQSGNTGGGAVVVTITIATPAVVSSTAHGLVGAAAVQFTTTGALPTGLSTGVTYYAVPNGPNQLFLAASISNAVNASYITTTGTQSGTHSMYQQAIGTTTGINDIAGILLTAGDWDCYGDANMNTGGVNVTIATFWLNTTASTNPNAPNFGQKAQWLGSTSTPPVVSGMRLRVSVNTSTIVYLSGVTTNGSVIGFGGSLCARRMI